MEQRLSLVTLGVADLERSRRFYVEGLGRKPGFDNGNIVFFQMAGNILALFARKALAEDAGQHETGSGFRGIALAHNLRSREDVDAALRQAAAAGATVTKPAAAQSWGGYSGYFADPDGHLREVAWNPCWIIGEDGTVRLGA